MYNRRITQVPSVGKRRRRTERDGTETDMVSLNVDIDDFSHDLISLSNREGNDINILEDEVAPGDTMECVIKPQPNVNKLFSFASLKTKTFDNNFKDIDGLKRKSELLYLSERYLHSKLYTPKLEALQRLVEPGKCPNREDDSKPYIRDSTATPRLSDTAYSKDGTSSIPLSRDSRNRYIEDHSGSVSLDVSGRIKDWRGYGRQSDESTTASKQKHDSKDASDKVPQESVITVLSSNAVVNGHTKKRIAIPRTAYQRLSQGEKPTNKVILKVVGNTQVGSPVFEASNDAQSWLNALENHMERVVNSIELCGNTIVNHGQVLSQLDAIKPDWMPPELFYLLCMKPIGMDSNEYIEMITEKAIDECSEVMRNFNLVNTNAMGYILDAENDTIKELMKLNKIHKRLVTEEDIYTRILSNMTDNFNNQVEELLQTTRQDLRLAAGDTYLQYGRIKNITTWKKGDPVIREKGFSHDKASKDKMKTLQRMQEVFGEGSHVALDASVDEAKYIYYMKLLQDMEESERDELQQQLARDRTQALAEYSLMEPPFKPENCLAWKTIGVSSKSIIWKMYNTVDCVPVVYKMRLLANLDAKGLQALKTNYEDAARTIKHMGTRLSQSKQIKFAEFSDVKERCIVERMELIRDIPVSELIEKTSQMTQAERLSQAQVIVREITKLVYRMDGLDFLLPLKSSRIYISSSGVTLSAGIPPSLLNSETRELLKVHENLTIASMLWGKSIEWYLPPEAQGDMAFTRDPDSVSRGHTWMIGKILYEATCQTPISRLPLDMSKIDLLEDETTRGFLRLCLEECIEKRPTVEELIRHPYMKKHSPNYGTFGPVDVGKAQCAVEILGDIETIVLNKINRTEKGVADYEPNENWHAVIGDSSEEDLCPLGNKYSYDFPNYNRQVGGKRDF